MNQIGLLLSALMVVVITTMAALCFFTDALHQLVQGERKYALGAVFLVYALLRAWRLKRAWGRYKQQSLSTQNESHHD
jgi:hypothetical protein